jgi:RHS repeat-associated protein
MGIENCSVIPNTEYDDPDIPNIHIFRVYVLAKFDFLPLGIDNREAIYNLSTLEVDYINLSVQQERTIGYGLWRGVNNFSMSGFGEAKQMELCFDTYDPEPVFQIVDILSSEWYDERIPGFSLSRPEYSHTINRAITPDGVWAYTHVYKTTLKCSYNPNRQERSASVQFNTALDVLDMTVTHEKRTGHFESQADLGLNYDGREDADVVFFYCDTPRLPSYTITGFEKVSGDDIPGLTFSGRNTSYAYPPENGEYTHELMLDFSCSPNRTANELRGEYTIFVKLGEFETSCNAIIVQVRGIDPGYITPAHQTFTSGNRAQVLSLVCDAMGTPQRWQVNINESGWIDIPGENSIEYDPAILGNTGNDTIICRYRVFFDQDDYPGDLISDQASITIYPRPAYGAISPELQTYPAGTDHFRPITFTGDGECQWQIGIQYGLWVDIPVATGNTYTPGILTENTSFRTKVCTSTGYEFSPVSTIILNHMNSGKVYLPQDNYIHKFTATKPLYFLSPVDANDGITEMTYYDGLGRPEYIGQMRASPTTSDIISRIEYDHAGRETVRTLPSQVLGLVRSYSELRDNQNEFFEQYYAEDENAYTTHVTTYQLSALNRIASVRSPGPNAPVVNYAYGVNAADDDVWHVVVDRNGNIYVKGRYSVGKLYKTSQTDSEGFSKVTFTDISGRVILERAENGSEKLDTYHVYDWKYRLTALISPEGSISLSSGVEYSPESDMVKNFCFTYRYDIRGNILEKRIPGAEPIVYKYDRMDRVVSSVSGNQRATYDDEKIVYEYDAYSRPSAIREIAKIGGLSRTKDMMVYQYNSYGSDATLAPRDLYLNDQRFTFDLSRVNGLKTYEKEACLAQGISGEPAFVERAFYYDSKGRLAQTVEKNHLGNISRYSTVYDFVGNVTSTIEEHAAGQLSYTIQRDNDLDHYGRVKSFNVTLRQRTGWEVATTTANVDYAYNVLGRNSRKQFGTTIPVLTAYDYTIQGWLKNQTSRNYSYSLGYLTADNNITGNIMSMVYSYPGSPSVYENGEKTYIYQYDPFSRLTSAINTGNYGEQLSYDGNGNITSMLRSTPAGSTAIDYDYAGTGNRLRRVTGMDTDYLYDLNGNLTHDPRKGLNFAYNFLNLLQAVSDFSGNIKARYYYGANGTKFYVTGGDGDNTRLDYLGGLVLRRDAVTGQTLGFDYNFGEGIIADGRTFYFEKDHLGSIRTVVDSQGEVVERNDYHAFGKLKEYPDKAIHLANRYRFNGKDWQTTGSLNLLDFGARMYDPDLGRWFVGDPLVEIRPWESQYLYAGGNPIRNIDPTGLDWYSFEEEDGETTKTKYQYTTEYRSQNDLDEAGIKGKYIGTTGNTNDRSQYLSLFGEKFNNKTVDGRTNLISKMAQNIDQAIIGSYRADYLNNPANREPWDQEYYTGATNMGVPVTVTPAMVSQGKQNVYFNYAGGNVKYSIANDLSSAEFNWKNGVVEQETGILINGRKGAFALITRNNAIFDVVRWAFPTTQAWQNARNRADKLLLNRKW